MSKHAPRRWRKSAHSASQSNCVEIASDLSAVRDSKNPDGPILQVGPTGLGEFLVHAQQGRYDR